MAPALDDVAYALAYSTPFRDDDHAVRSQAFPEPPDRRHRISIFAEAYGIRYIDDYNGPEQEGVSPFQVNQVNGARFSAAASSSGTTSSFGFAAFMRAGAFTPSTLSRIASFTSMPTTPRQLENDILVLFVCSL